MSWQMYPTASSEASLSISVLPGVVTLRTSTWISSGHSWCGNSAHAIYATHWAAELGRFVSVPSVSNTCYCTLTQPRTLVLLNYIITFILITHKSICSMFLYTITYIFLDIKSVCLLGNEEPALFVLLLNGRIFGVERVLELQAGLHAHH